MPPPQKYFQGVWTVTCGEVFEDKTRIIKSILWFIPFRKISWFFFILQVHHTMLRLWTLSTFTYNPEIASEEKKVYCCTIFYFYVQYSLPNCWQSQNTFRSIYTTAGTPRRSPPLWDFSQPPSTPSWASVRPSSFLFILHHTHSLSVLTRSFFISSSTSLGTHRSDILKRFRSLWRVAWTGLIDRH